MSKIVGVIPPQSFELIRNRITHIIGEELEQQFVLSYDANLDVQVWMERTTPFDVFQEMNPAVINVSFLEGDYDNEDVNDADGLYSFAVDCLCRGVATDSETADTQAAVIVQMILGKVRAILNASQYKTLDFPALSGIIKNRRSAKIVMFDPKKYISSDSDTTLVQAGRIIFQVKALETVEQLTAPIVSGTDTYARMGLTNKGYQWIRNGLPIPVPPGPPFSVPLLNSDDKVIYTINQNSDNPFPLADQIIIDGQGNEVSVPYDPETPFVTEVCPVICLPATAVLKNSDDDVISTTSIPAGDSQDILAPDATAVVKDTAGNVVGGGTIPSDGSQEFTAPDGSISVRNSENTQVASGVVRSGGSLTLNAPDGIADVKNSNGDTVVSGPVPSGKTEEFTAPDGTAIVKNSSGTVVDSGGVPSGDSAEFAAPDAVVVLKDSAGTIIGGGNVPSGGAQDFIAPDGSVELNSVLVASVKSDGLVNIPVMYENGTLVGSLNGGVWEIPDPIKDLVTRVQFDTGATLDYTITIDSDTAGTYTTAAFSGGMASATYEVNGSPDTLPFTLVATDTLRIIPDAVGVIKLSGTYP
jgi:hypothetical protein